MSTNDRLSVSPLDDLDRLVSTFPQTFVRGAFEGWRPDVVQIRGEQGASICIANCPIASAAFENIRDSAQPGLTQQVYAYESPDACEESAVERDARRLRADAAPPREPVPVHRALDRADRCLGPAHPLRIREHGLAQLRGRRSPTAPGGRRPRRPADRWRSRQRAGRGEPNRTAR